MTFGVVFLEILEFLSLICLWAHHRVCLLNIKFSKYWNGSFPNNSVTCDSLAYVILFLNGKCSGTSSYIVCLGLIRVMSEWCLLFSRMWFLSSLWNFFVFVVFMWFLWGAGFLWYLLFTDMVVWPSLLHNHSVFRLMLYGRAVSAGESNLLLIVFFFFFLFFSRTLTYSNCSFWILSGVQRKCPWSNLKMVLILNYNCIFTIEINCGYLFIFFHIAWNFNQFSFACNYFLSFFFLVFRAIFWLLYPYCRHFEWFFFTGCVTGEIFHLWFLKRDWKNVLLK